MAIVTSVLYGNEKPTKEQIEEVRQAAKKPIVYDEDCPPLTKEQLKEFARIAKEQRKLRKKTGSSNPAFSRNSRKGQSAW